MAGRGHHLAHTRTTKGSIMKLELPARPAGRTVEVAPARIRLLAAPADR